MFFLGLLCGALVTGVLFVIFYKNNLNHLAKARKALVDVYERAGSQVEDIVKGVDKKVDKKLEEKSKN